MGDLEEDELRQNGNDLSCFGAKKKSFRERALILVTIGQEGDEDVCVDDDVRQLSSVLGIGVLSLRLPRRPPVRL